MFVLVLGSWFDLLFANEHFKILSNFMLIEFATICGKEKESTMTKWPIKPLMHYNKKLGVFQEFWLIKEVLRSMIQSESRCRVHWVQCRSLRCLPMVPIEYSSFFTQRSIQLLITKKVLAILIAIPYPLYLWSSNVWMSSRPRTWVSL